MPPSTFIGFVEVDEGCYRLCLKCLKNAKIIMVVIIIEYLRMCVRCFTDVKAFQD